MHSKPDSLIFLGHFSKALFQVFHPVTIVLLSILYRLLQQPLHLVQSAHLRRVVAVEIPAQLIVVAVRGKKAAQKAQEHVVMTQRGAEGSLHGTLDHACYWFGLILGCEDLGHVQYPGLQNVLRLRAEHHEDVQSGHELLEERRHRVVSRWLLWCILVVREAKNTSHLFFVIKSQLNINIFFKF